MAAIAAAVPALSALPSVAPGAGFRLTGGKVPRQSHRYSGRTAIRAQIDVHEPKSPEDPDTPLAFSMEGDHRQPPSALIPRFWAPGWNSVQSLNKFQQEVGGHLRGGDPGMRLIEPHPQIKAACFKDIPARRQTEECAMAVRSPSPHLWLRGIERSVARCRQAVSETLCGPASGRCLSAWNG